MKDESSTPPGWTYNPSAWSQRLPVVALACLGLAIAMGLALYQWGVLNEVWEPFFPGQSRTILKETWISQLTWPFPDAFIGALGYAADAVTGLIGGRRRWRTMPWIVVLFGILVVPLGVVGIALVVAQPVLFDAWCTLCLCSAAISLLMIGPALDEVLVSLQYLRRARDAGLPSWRVFWKGGPPLEVAGAAPEPEAKGLPWASIAAAAAALSGVWLMAAPPVLGYDPFPAEHDTPVRVAADVHRIAGPLIATFSTIAAWEVARPARWGSFVLGLWLVLAPWLLAFPPAAGWNSVVVGLLVAGLSLVKGRPRAAMGGGWRALGAPAPYGLGGVAGAAALRKVVVVTGASAGVGRAVAKKFAANGWSVGLLARGRAGLEGAAREVEELGGRALILECDVADPDQVEAAAERAERELGPLDVWVNDAMTTIFGRFDEITTADYKRATEVTYLGTVHGTLSALRRMKARNHGAIVQVGSALAYRAIPLQAPYCGAKHAIRGFTDSIRSELLHDRVRVHLSMVQLPAHNTPQFSWGKALLPNHPQPVPPIFQPELAARAVYLAAHSRRREVVLGTRTWIIIAGNKLFPGFGDWYLARNGFDSQQMPVAVRPGRRDNLYEPVDRDEDFSTHGVFDDGARGRSLQMTLNERKAAVLCAVAFLLAVVVGTIVWAAARGLA